MNIFTGSSAVILAALVVSCTGDPTRGGIFWSASKAKERQAELYAQMGERQNRLAELEAANKSQQARVNSLRSQISAKKARLRCLQHHSASGGSEAEEIDMLKAEISRLEEEMRAAGQLLR